MRNNLLLAAAAGVALCVHAVADRAEAQTRTTLDIYVVDVEGGNATLYVPPSGKSVLIDTGNVAPDAAKRDAERIMAAARDARLTQIDHLITTHWHGDHFGGMAELASRIPIREFIDHGPNIQPAPVVDEFLAQTYPALYGKAKHTVAKPGDVVAVAGLDWRIVASAGQVLKTPLAGAGAANRSCAGFKPQAVDTTENAQSVGSIVTFGKFRVAQLGDLTWNKEFELMCPNNPVGTVDLFVVSHHGLNISNSEALVHAIHPRVAIMNNGTRKGGLPGADEDHPQLSRPGGPLADSFLPAQRPGIHGAGHVHRQPARRAVGGDAGGADRCAGARTERTACARPQRTGLLDQAVGATGRDVHRDQCAERLCQDLFRHQAGHELAMVLPHESMRQVMRGLVPRISTWHGRCVSRSRMA